MKLSSFSRKVIQRLGKTRFCQSLYVLYASSNQRLKVLRKHLAAWRQRSALKRLSFRPSLEVLEVRYVPTGLLVNSLTQEPGGFKAIFNEAINPSPINLYDYGSTFGPADVTVQGPSPSTSYINGSLFIDPSDQTITFLKGGSGSSGQMAAGTYSVTFRSASNGFEDMSGNLLDSGSNYTANLIISSSSAVIVGIPSFARGPNASANINLPNTASNYIPITLYSNGSSTTSGQFVLQYNSSLLSLTGASVNTALSGVTFTLDPKSQPGDAVIDFSSTSALASGTVRLGGLIAQVPNTAPYAEVQLLHWSSLTLNGGAVGATNQDAIQVVAYFGDADGNGTYSGTDATMISNVSVAFDTGFAAYPTVAPVIIAGLDGSTSVDGADVTLMNEYVDTPYNSHIPHTPSATHFVVTGPSPAAEDDGASFTITVEALDQFNHVQMYYSGTVEFLSSDPSATLPGNYTFVSSDLGYHTFTNDFALATGGPQTLTAVDTVTASVTGNITVDVLDAVFAFARTNDPGQSTTVPIGAGDAAVLPGTGSLLLSEPLSLNVTPDTPVLGGAPALVYNSDTVDVKPIIELVYSTNPGGSVPSNLLAKLNWNSGGYPATWTTFSTSGHSAGDTYDLALPVATAMTTGYYPFTAEIEDPSSGTYTYSSDVAVVAQGSGDPFGQGWSLAGVEQLVSVTGGALLVDNSTGSVRFFSLSGSTYTSPLNDFGTLTYSGGTYTYTAPDQTQWTFASNGNLSTIVDSDGLTRTFSYNGSGLLTLINDPDGSTATFTYSSGLLSTIAEPGSRTVTVTMSSGDLASITNPDGGVLSFTYNGSNQLTNEHFAPMGTVTYGYGSNGTLTTVALDAASVWTVGAADTPGLATSPAADFSSAVGVITDPLGHAATYTLDPLGRETQLQTPNGGTGVLTETWNLYPGTGLVLANTDPLGNVTAYQYDARGNTKANFYPNGTETSATYNGFAEPTTVDDQRGNLTTNTYNGTTGDLLTTTDPLGDVTTFTWNTGTYSGLVQSVENALDNYTTYTYYASGSYPRLLLSVTAPLLETTTYYYDASGNITGIKDPLGRNTTTTYDAMRRVTSVTQPAVTTTTTLYNVNGNVTETVDANGNETTYAYDALGRETAMTTAVGSSVAATTQYLYDADSNVTQTADPLGRVTRNYYDSLNRVTQTIKGYGTAAPSTTTNFYDADGNITQTTTAVTSVESSLTQPSGSPISEGFAPYVVATGDLNGDGKSDLVLADYASNNFVVLLSNGNGTFAASTNTTLTDDAYGLAIGDFNGDGNGDLAVPNNSGSTVSVLLGNGNGTFGAPTNYTFSTPPDNVIAADFTGNGILDLAVTCGDFFTAGSVNILLGNGNGTFQTPISYAVGSGPCYLAAGELTNNGIPDLVVSNYYSGTVSVLLGNGNGTFQGATNYAVGSGPAQLVLADFIQGGNLDLAVSNFSSSSISVMLGNGNGTFGAVSNISLSNAPFGLAAVQLTGQNNVDLVAAEEFYGTVLLLGNGNGTFGSPSTLATDGGARTIAVGDFTGNGASDIAVANSSSDNVTILLQSLTTTTTTTTYVYDALNRLISTTNGDGDISTAMYDAGGNVTGTMNGLGQLTYYRVDPLDRVSVTIDPTGGITTALFDKVGNVTETIDGDGNLTTYSYSANNLLLSTTRGAGKRRRTDHHRNLRRRWRTANVDRRGRQRDLVPVRRQRPRHGDHLSGRRRGQRHFDRHHALRWPRPSHQRDQSNRHPDHLRL